MNVKWVRSIRIAIISLLPVTGIILLLSIYLAFSELILPIESRKVLEQYKYLSIHPSQNESSISEGLVNIFHDSVRNDFLSYRDDLGNYFLISTPGSNEFVCSGSCACEEESSNRKASNVVLSKVGLTYLVSALSSLAAYTFAEEYFEEECEDELYDSCSHTTIKTEVDGCETVDNYLSGSTTVQKGVRKYVCQGNCLVSKKLVIEQTVRMADELGCEGLKLNGEVELDGSGVKVEQINSFVKWKFQTEHLIPYCRKGSKAEYLYESPKGVVRRRTVKLCVGSQGSSGFNPSINCRQVYLGRKSN